MSKMLKNDKNDEILIFSAQIWKFLDFYVWWHICISIETFWKKMVQKNIEIGLLGEADRMSPSFHISKKCKKFRKNKKKIDFVLSQI